MTAPVMMMNCPSDGTLAAFIDGRLESEARPEVVAHLSICAACRDVLQTAHELQSTGVRHVWIIPATLAAAAAIAAALFLGPAGDQFRMSRNERALIAATANLQERPIAARPSIDIAYKRRVAFRGGESEKTGEADLLQAASVIVDIADRNRSAANLHKAGVALLLTGRDNHGALLRLEQSQGKQTTPNADLLNDLAAAYYETDDEARAKAAIDRAWKLKQSAPIAWTRAVILDSQQAWKDYLAIDASSEWSAEARSRLEDQIGN